MTRRLAVVALLLVAAVACGGNKANLPGAGSVEADKFLFDRGTDALGRKRWLEAREYFRRLVDTYPQSAYRQDAKLGIGDSYLGEDTVESNILAVNEFREFISFFPGNERTDYAQYKIAVAYAQQMLGPDRDRTPAREALDACNLFLSSYPNSALRPEVEKVRRRAQDQLSGNDYKVGLHYYRIGWYPGSIDRFKKLLEADPEYTGRDAVYFYLGEIYHKLKQDPEALPYYDRIVKEFEKSDYLERARKRIREINLAPETKPKTTDGIKR